MIFLRYGCGLVIVALSACSTLQPNPSGLRIVAKHDVIVRQDGASEHPLKKNEEYVLESLPTLIEAPGYMSVLITRVPEGGNQRADIELRPLVNWSGEVFENKVAEQVSDVVSQVNEIQLFLAQDQASLALEKTEILQKNYPRVIWINFLRASILTSLGRYDEAKTYLTLALEKFPSHEQGLHLYEILNGAPKRRQPASGASNE